MMKMAQGLFGLLLTSQLYATSDNVQNIPLHMRTGRTTLSSRDVFRNVMNELRNISPERRAEMSEARRQQQLASIREQLPEWMGAHVPASILLYTDIPSTSDPVERAKRYMQAALLMRDMYLDMPINHELQTYLVPEELRYDDASRHHYVGLLFFQALMEIEQNIEFIAAEDSYDAYASMAQLSRWAGHHLVLGRRTSLEGLKTLASAMNAYTEKANVAAYR